MKIQDWSPEKKIDSNSFFNSYRKKKVEPIIFHYKKCRINQNMVYVLLKRSEHNSEIGKTSQNGSHPKLSTSPGFTLCATQFK